MARPALATIDDLTAAVGDVPNPANADYLLRRASALVRAYAGRTWLNEDETALRDVPPDIPDVVVAMVERATRNPSGAVSETDAAGPYQYTRSFGPDAASRIYLDRGDKLVIRAATGRSAGIGVLSTTRGPLETADVAGPHGTMPEETLAGLHQLLGGS